MKSSTKRNIHRSIGALPPKGTSEYIAITEFYKQNPIVDKASAKRMFEKTKNSLEAQAASSCGLITEKTLREFQHEYTVRSINQGVTTMPLSFNLFEAYFEYRKPEIFYELLEEENYEVSFFEFLDFVLDENLNFSSDFFEESFPEDLIFNFNIDEKEEDVFFQSADGIKYKIFGVSLIRRESEITVTLILGKTITDIVSESIALEKLDPSHAIPGKEGIIEDYNNKVNQKSTSAPQLIKDEIDYQKCIFGIRYDIESSNIDFQYLLEEFEDLFSVSTDNLTGIYNHEKNEFYGRITEDHYEAMIQKLNKHLELFEVVKLCLFLPDFINQKESFLVSNDFSTDFKEIATNPISRRKFRDIYGKTYINKTIYSLHLGDTEKDSLEINEDHFNIQRSGYWKELNVNDIGENKKGGKMIGKTWVNKTETFYHKKNKKTLKVEQRKRKFNEKDSGYIYIVRNPLHPKDVFKIGLTRSFPETRIDQLTNTSNADKFYLFKSWEVKNCVVAEKEIHKKLNSWRLDPNREFFTIHNMEECIDTVQSTIDKINNE